MVWFFVIKLIITIFVMTPLEIMDLHFYKISIKQNKAKDTAVRIIIIQCLLVPVRSIQNSLLFAKARLFRALILNFRIYALNLHFTHGGRLATQ